MKLLFCTNCEDLFKLQGETRFCQCGEASGRYLADGLYAEYRGDTAIPLGFDNGSFMQAIHARPQHGLGRRFLAFVIPVVCPTMRQLEGQ